MEWMLVVTLWTGVVLDDPFYVGSYPTEVACEAAGEQALVDIERARDFYCY